MFSWKQKTQTEDVTIPALPPPERGVGSGSSLLASLAAISETAEYRALVAQLEHWPPDSLISSPQRAMLHWLISEARARCVLEIGTGFAGTTLLLAASMLQAGRGRVYTIDPYGQERAPQIIARWPRSLQEITIFWPKFSSDFFVPSLDVPPLDLVLVDGNHSYPNVMHDLFASYEALRPGGLIVVDNAEQVDVLDASRDFGRLSPRAELARAAVTGQSQHSTLGIDLDDHLEPLDTPNAFIIIRKPETVYLNRRALAFHLNQFRGCVVELIMGELVNANSHPVRLNGSINLRRIPNAQDDAQALDVGERFITEIAPGRQAFEYRPTRLVLPPARDEGRVFLEANLYTPGEELMLGSLAINGFPVQPGRNFMRPRR
ncbi:class I SAM-dependent methyltransferase [Phenylobacterium sp.]|uniref:class I SAM-dependent methyltransferase n=1 Tax=Phenylobacterium sp. TaxID=1871053 RepID=UPI003BAB4564